MRVFYSPRLDWQAAGKLQICKVDAARKAEEAAPPAMRAAENFQTILSRLKDLEMIFKSGNPAPGRKRLAELIEFVEECVQQ